MSTEVTNSFHPEEKSTPGAADDPSINIAQPAKHDGISQNTCEVKSGSNASISDSLEKKSSENIRAGAEPKLRIKAILLPLRLPEPSHNYSTLLSIQLEQRKGQLPLC